MDSDVRLLTGSFDPAAEIAAFSKAHAAAGGIASFIGQVRAGGGVEALELLDLPKDFVRPGDRVEIYRPLKVDPKVARRERFVRQGARATGLFARRRPGGKAGY